MTVEGTTASSPEELVVSLEQANALIDLIGAREGGRRSIERDARQWTHQCGPRRLWRPLR